MSWCRKVDASCAKVDVIVRKSGRLIKLLESPLESVLESAFRKMDETAASLASRHFQMFKILLQQKPHWQTQIDTTAQLLKNVVELGRVASSLGLGK